MDVLTSQDKTFWTGVLSLLETTKRPIIFCANGNPIRIVILENPLVASNSCISPASLEILSEIMQIVLIEHLCYREIACYSQMLLNLHHCFVDFEELERFCNEYQGDIRRTLSQLELSTKRLDTTNEQWARIHMDLPKKNDTSQSTLQQLFQCLENYSILDSNKADFNHVKIIFIQDSGFILNIKLEMKKNYFSFLFH